MVEYLTLRSVHVKDGQIYVEMNMVGVLSASLTPGRLRESLRIALNDRAGFVGLSLNDPYKILGILLGNRAFTSLIRRNDSVMLEAAGIAIVKDANVVVEKIIHEQ